MSNHIYIGKIPAYNSRINDPTIQYEKRLLNNLTVTKFEPIAYRINLDLSTAKDDLQAAGTEALKIFGEDGEVKNNPNTTQKKAAQKYGLYTLGKTLSDKSPIEGLKVSVSDALKTWQDMQKTFGGNPVSYNDKAVDSFSIIATTDSTINENITNDYGENMINKIPSMLGGKIESLFQTSLKVSSLIKGNVAAVDSQKMLDLLEVKNDLADNQLLQILSAQALGIQTSLPKMWIRSDYNNTSSFTIKLISPSGHVDDVAKYILRPLRILTLACSPVTFDGVSFGYPPIWKVETEGLGTSNLSAITAMTISRGGQDTMFNRYNQPTNVDVRLTVEPLVQGFATPLIPNLNFYADMSLETNVRQLVPSPESIFQSIDFRNKNTNSDRGIRLDTLVLS